MGFRCTFALMKNVLAVILSLIAVLPIFAQEHNQQISSSVENIDDDSQYLNGMVPVASFPSPKEETTQTDSLHLPPIDNYGRVYDSYSWRYPYIGSFGLWDIHEGLNVQMGLSAFTSFGKGGFSGWGQNISAIYAEPINDRLSLAVGGYLNNYSTGRGSFRSAGITAVLNYRFNEHWEAYVYGQKSFVDNSSTMFSHYGPGCYGYGPFGYGYGMGYGPMYDMGMYGDRIGAGVTWKPNQSTSVQVQFEVSSDPRSSFHNNVKDHWEMPSETTPTSNRK